MASRHSPLAEQRRAKLNERGFWQAAYLAAELPILLKANGGRSPEGLAHIAAEYADASLREYRMRFP